MMMLKKGERELRTKIFTRFDAQEKELKVVKERLVKTENFLIERA